MKDKMRHCTPILLRRVKHAPSVIIQPDFFAILKDV